MQRVRHAALDRARGGHERLGDDEAAEHTLAAPRPGRRAAAEDVVFDALQVERAEQFADVMGPWVRSVWKDDVSPQSGRASSGSMMGMPSRMG